MKILFASAEIAPYSKSGGLGDVGQALPKSLVKNGCEIKVFLPLYRNNYVLLEKMMHLGDLEVEILNKKRTASYYLLKENNIEYIFIKNDVYFNRERLYGYYDEAERFAFLTFAILEAIEFLNFVPDIIHVNDWHTAMLPYVLDQKYRWRKLYHDIKTLLTIHNLEYQGSFVKEAESVFDCYNDSTYMHFGNLNFLKAGIMRASAINTVSKTYRNEILQGVNSCTLDGALKLREENFFGILNGIDDLVFSPISDSLISCNYNLSSYKKGKKRCKEDLCKELFLPESKAPLICFIGRLAKQKGIDLMRVALEDVVLYSNANFVLLGSGDKEYENYFDYLCNKYPGRIATYIGYNEKLAHQIYAASDFLIMPSLFEPCGLSQIIALKYGTIPIVRETGGLADTVIPYNIYTKKGNGLGFANYHGFEFKDTIFKALDIYNTKPDDLKALINNAMTSQFNTDLMAKEYTCLYKKIMEGY